MENFFPHHGKRLAAALASALLGMAAAPARADDPPAPAAPAVAFLSDFRGGGSLLHFLNRSGEIQKDRYVTEGTVELDFSLADWARGPDLRMRFSLVTGMGRSVAENLPFSPKEMTYEIHPFLEHRTPRLLCTFGLQHVCQHLIFKDYEEPWYLREGHELSPDVYYNRLHAGIGTPESRRDLLVQTFFGPDAPPVKPRWTWHIEGGAYLRSLGGLMDSESLYGDNDWIADLRLDLQLLLMARPAWALFAASRTHLLADTHDNTFWRSRLELEAFFAPRGYGASAFLAWNALDEHPRDSREDLLELGGRFFF